jgi:hypothetical protein
LRCNLPLIAARFGPNSDTIEAELQRWRVKTQWKQSVKHQTADVSRSISQFLFVLKIEKLSCCAVEFL